MADTSASIAPAKKPPRHAAPAKKSAPRKAPAKKAPAHTAAKAVVSKKAAAETVVRKAALRSYKQSAPTRVRHLADRRDAAGNRRKPTRQEVAHVAGYKTGTAIRKGMTPKGLLSQSNPRRALVAEFLICFMVLGGAAIVAPQGEKSGMPRLMSKGTGLALLFLVLALFSSAGQKSARFAAGLGALVTAGYLFTSPDALNILHWMQQFYGAGGQLATAGLGAGGAVTLTSGDNATEPSEGTGDVSGVGGEPRRPPASDTGNGIAQSAPGGPANPGGTNKQGLT